jgi:hypothetical protein
LKIEIKERVEKLVLKLLLEKHLVPEQVEGRSSVILNKFWEEWDNFNSRTGRVYNAERHIWKSDDITSNKTWRWHKMNSYNDTNYFGKFACRVTSKIVGIGNAERCWGDVKTLKDGKRSHLSSAATSKQATIYGSACAERAEHERERKRGDQDFVMWDELDMESLGLDKFGKNLEQVLPSTGTVRVFNCYIKDWEKEILKKKDSMNGIKLGQKYGGLSFLETEGDSDNPRSKKVIYTLDKNDCRFSDLKGAKGWTILATTAKFDKEIKDEQTFDNMQINDDLCGLIHSYYKDFPNDNIKIVTKEGKTDRNGNWIWENDERPVKKPRPKKKAPPPATSHAASVPRRESPRKRAGLPTKGNAPKKGRK